jgi:NitT/TauT family transport system ATP-binding protein
MLELRDVALRYDGPRVLEGVDLDLSAGVFASLVGPSGSGKSSLLRAITGLHRPDAGDVTLELPDTQVGFLFQDDALLPWRTAAQNVALGLRIQGADKRVASAEAETWLDRLGVGGFGDRYPRELSGGQRKRVALAQVLALRPRLLLMDEPFASLDAIVRHRVTADLLRWVEAEDITVLLVTHDLEEALALSDVVHLLSQGPQAQIVQSYEVPIPRPRDPLEARTHPAFGDLLKRLWEDLTAVSDAQQAAPEEPRRPQSVRAVAGGAR